MQTLALKIRHHLRESNRFTQEHLADQLAVSVKTYQRIESGKIGITLRQAQMLAHIFHVSVETFFTAAAEYPAPTAAVPAPLENIAALQWENVDLKKRLDAVREEKTRLLGIIERLLDTSSKLSLNFSEVKSANLLP